MGNMGIFALIAAIILYIIISIQYYMNKDYPHCLVWAAYALANIGFLWHMILQMRGVIEQ